MEPIASRKGCSLTASIKGDIPVIPGDTDSLTQLLWNLLQNAITHSNCNNVELTVEAANRSGTGTCVTVVLHGIVGG